MRAYAYAIMAAACFIGMAVLGCTHIYYNKPIAETSENDMRKVLVDDSFANSIIIVLRRGRLSLPDDCQCDLLRQQSDGTWSVERRITIDSKDYVVVRALKPGLYRAELTFYGVRQDVVDGLAIGPQKGQYVELKGQGLVGCLRFKVVKDDGNPLENAFVVLYSQRDFPVRDSGTNKAGETIPLWIASVLYPGDHYFAKVYYPGKTGLQVGTSEKIAVNFTKESHTRTVLIRTNAN